MQMSMPRTRIVAALGPTNTGKTYLAFERMLGHGSGMIGFPLRLLARENYERAVELKGARQVALITGEEKILPPYAKYFFCTVESMPIDREVDFLAVDEIQLCADADRGHVFTDRLLHARGRQETMFMGSDAFRSLITQLVPEAEGIEGRVAMVITPVIIDGMWYTLVALLLSQPYVLSRLKARATAIDRLTGVALILLAIRVLIKT